MKPTPKRRCSLLHIREHAFRIPVAILPMAILPMAIGMHFAFCLCLWSCKEESAPDVKSKAVFIIVDGISADVIEKLNPPALEEISKAGGYTRAYVGGEKGTYTETPTISAVCYNSLPTGTWVHKHNVWGNSIKDPN